MIITGQFIKLFKVSLFKHCTFHSNFGVIVMNPLDMYPQLPSINTVIINMLTLSRLMDLRQFWVPFRKLNFGKINPTKKSNFCMKVMEI